MESRYKIKVAEKAKGVSILDILGLKIEDGATTAEAMGKPRIA